MIQPRFFLYYFFVGTILILLPSKLEAQVSTQTVSDETSVNGVFRNVVEIQERELIQLILDDFFIPEDLSLIEKIEILDVSNVGFGSQNILIIYPSRNVYVLDRPSSEELIGEMQSWRLRDVRRDADISLDATYFYPGKKDSAIQVATTAGNESKLDIENDLAINAIISDLLGSLQRNYQDTTISFRFERDQNGFTFQLWDYNSEALLYEERPVIQPDTVLISEVIRDTVYLNTISDTSQFLQSLHNQMGALPIETTKKRRFDQLTKFNFSLLNSFIDYDPVSSKPSDTLYSYHPGFGIELGYSLEPRIVFLSFGGGAMYHPGKSFETPSETGQGRDPNRTIIRSFHGYFLYGIGSTGLNFLADNRFNIKMYYSVKHGLYYPLQKITENQPEPITTTFAGIEFGVQEPDISFFVRQSLVTRMNIDSILEYGVTLSF